MPRSVHAPALPATLALALALALGATGCATIDDTAGRQDVRYEDGGQLGDAGYFYDALSPYGRWVQLEPYGLCWMPDGLGAGWSPYSMGFWTYSDYGWTWVDQEPWGWAPFHYGRWWLDPQYGWVWIPGTEWAPAWVAWRGSDAYVAWAPLPPTIHWSFTVPLHSGGPAVAALPSTWWNVARPADLFDSSLSDRLVPSVDKATALAGMEDRTRIAAVANRPVNEGIPVAWVEQRIGRTVPRYRVVDAPATAPDKGGVVAGGAVEFFRPDLAGGPRRGLLRPGLRQRPPQAEVEPAPRGAGSGPTGGSTGGPTGGPASGLVGGWRAGRRPAAPADSLKLEAFLEGERKRMLREQAEEAKQAGQGSDLDALLRRHALEARAFEGYAAAARDSLRAGLRPRFQRFDRRAATAQRERARAAGRDTTRD